MIPWLLASALAADLLAPTLRDLDASLDRADLLAERARAAEIDLAGAQAAWIEDGCDVGCPRSRAVPLVARSRQAGAELRATLQSARAEIERALGMASFATLRPLVDPRRASRVGDLRSRIDRASRAYLARAAWAERWIEPEARRLGLPSPECPPAEARMP